MTSKLRTILRETGRAVDLHGNALTTERLFELAYPLKRERQSEYPGDMPVDVFANPAVYELLQKRAVGWVYEKYGPLPLRGFKDPVEPTVLQGESVALAFIRGDFKEPLAYLLCVPDLIWCSGHWDVMCPKKHLVIENFT